MKITGIGSVVVNAEMRNWIFVKVETDQPGSMAGARPPWNGRPAPSSAPMEDLAPLLIGRDPRDIEQACGRDEQARLLAAGRHRHDRRSPASRWRCGTSWARALGVPVWRLLGGKVRDGCAIYTHLGLGDMRAVYETMSPSALVEQAPRW